MAQTIKLKRSSVAGRVPSTSDLALGEIGINTTDGKAYLKKSVSGSESIVEITGAGAGGASDSFKTIAVSGQSSVVATNSTDTLEIIAGNNISLTTNASSQTVTIASTGINQGLNFGTFTSPTGITLDMGGFS